MAEAGDGPGHHPDRGGAAARQTDARYALLVLARAECAGRTASAFFFFVALRTSAGHHATAPGRGERPPARVATASRALPGPRPR